jgi:hypothetical protein
LLSISQPAAALAAFSWRDEMNLDFAQLRSRSEPAKLLGISVDTLKAMEKRGEVPERVQVRPEIIGYTQYKKLCRWRYRHIKMAFDWDDGERRKDRNARLRFLYISRRINFPQGLILEDCWVTHE